MHHASSDLRALLLLLAGASAFAPTLAAQRARPHIPTGGSNWVQRQGAVGAPISVQDLTTGLLPQDVVQTFVGPNAVVSNVTFRGTDISLATFQGGLGVLGFDAGILLSSGNANSVVGPDNVADDTSTSLGIAGDPDLDALIPGYVTFDATVLEFDFNCTQGQTISFEFVFASEEYNEYVNSIYNDVFGFFVNGVNVAVLPNGAPLSINNLNRGNPFDPVGGVNGNLYRNNNCNDLPAGAFPCSNIQTEMDGLTTVIAITATIQPGTNHIKLAIADAGDDILDSGIFLRASSFQCRSACNGTVVHYGTGCLGTGGIAPTIEVAGCPRTASTIDVEVDHARGGAMGCLAATVNGRDQRSLAGCTWLLQDPALILTWFQLAGAGGVPDVGHGEFNVVIPDDPGLAGFVVRCQSLVIDPAGPQGFAATNAVEITIGS